MTRYLPVLGKDGISRYVIVDVGPRAAKPAHGGAKTLPAGGGTLRVKQGGTA